ncbi:hypothetical protein ACQ7DA_15485 [Zafaria sp. J156]|uniref:hypothetical protein n=1 Tax=Zafaria sp. J156 TaxID=3116490 RepID=UPI002EA20FCC|nr:hypothetical protein [Zafaria sp. J156]
MTASTGSGDYTPRIMKDWGQTSCRSRLATRPLIIADQQATKKVTGGSRGTISVTVAAVDGPSRKWGSIFAAALGEAGGAVTAGEEAPGEADDAGAPRC